MCRYWYKMDKMVQIRNQLQNGNEQVIIPPFRGEIRIRNFIYGGPLTSSLGIQKHFLKFLKLTELLIGNKCLQSSSSLSSIKKYDRIFIQGKIWEIQASF